MSQTVERGTRAEKDGSKTQESTPYVPSKSGGTSSPEPELNGNQPYGNRLTGGSLLGSALLKISRMAPPPVPDAADAR